MIDFDELLDDDEAPLLKPRDIFMALDKDAQFSFPRDIQTEVMDAWFKNPDQQDTIIKLNVGSGKTLIGLMLLQSSINSGIGPALFVCPDNQLVTQVMEEAALLGLDVTNDPKDTDFQSGSKICVINIYKLFNGKSVFGVGVEGKKIDIGTVIIDDAHACIATISQQFQIRLKNTHKAYGKIFDLVAKDLKSQSASRFLELKDSDPRAVMEVPFWSWRDNSDDILQILHDHKDKGDLVFSYPLLRDILPQCRCIISGQRMEIEPICPPTDLIKSFSRAKRRIYMTATLSDDSVLVTQFGADPNKLSPPIVPTSSQSMGERMILMPQEINPHIQGHEIMKMLLELSKKENVVVIVPSEKVADGLKDHADQILIGDNVIPGIEKLKSGHVGLSILVNRYDGIDLPKAACRVLAIFELPEVRSFRDAADMAVLSNSDDGLRRQMQRIEQGMGRGVRSVDDYCVVLLCGIKLTSRLKTPKGKSMMTGATRAQLELSTKLAKQLEGSGISDIKAVIMQALNRDSGWVKASKKALAKAETDGGLSMDEVSIAVRESFDAARIGDFAGAQDALNKVINSTEDPDLKAWLKIRLAEVTQPLDPAQAQKIVVGAHKLNPSVVKPIAGIGFRKIKPADVEQAGASQNYLGLSYLESDDRILTAKGIVEDLVFDPDKVEEFESALDQLGRMIGLKTQRPEKIMGEGPDNLWACRSPAPYLVIECKSGATSKNGISKDDLGQLGQSMEWFEKRYAGGLDGQALMIHPLNYPGPQATPIDGMKLITGAGLEKLKKAFTAYINGLADPEIFNNVARVSALLKAHSLTPLQIVGTFSQPIKAKAPKKK